MGWDGIGWDRMGSDGMGRDGMGWGRMGCMILKGMENGQMCGVGSNEMDCSVGRCCGASVLGVRALILLGLCYCFGRSC